MTLRKGKFTKSTLAQMPTLLIWVNFLTTLQKTRVWIEHSGSAELMMIRPVRWNIGGGIQKGRAWEAHEGTCCKVMTERQAVLSESKMNWGFPQTGNRQFLTILLKQTLHCQENVYPNVHHSTVYNSLDMEAT